MWHLVIYPLNMHVHYMLKSPNAARRKQHARLLLHFLSLKTALKIDCQAKRIFPLVFLLLAILPIFVDGCLRLNVRAVKLFGLLFDEATQYYLPSNNGILSALM